jgi:starch synthase
VKVLFATSEAHPLVKTGGLADVSGALPAALRREGVDARLLMPGYPAVLAATAGAGQTLATLRPEPFPEARLVAGTLDGDVPLLVLDCPPLYQREGGPYQRGDGSDWPDNDVRFGLLARVAAALAGDDSPLDWKPDLLHCNDWQTGLAPAYMALSGRPAAPSLLTIHNLAYQGIFQPGTLPRVGLPWDWFRLDALEYYGNISYLKAGLQFATALSTVSPTYAREIQGEPLGFGLQGLLAWRSEDLTGILNGIDTAAWNPAADPSLPQTYAADCLARKEVNRRALRMALGLDASPGVPVAGVISRLTHQKGLDLLLACADRMLELPVQLAVLGSGDASLEHGFTQLARRHPGRVGVRLGFDEAFSHLIEAGADFFVMPSRFEPCGLNQMYSQHYGTPVVARATGGLADSIVDLAPGTAWRSQAATGFLFDEATPEALLTAIARAAEAYRNRHLWRHLQRNGMGRDFSWNGAARRYRDLYRSLLMGAAGKAAGTALP